MRNILASWDRVDPQASEIFDATSEGAFFVFDATRMRRLQDELRRARIDADMSVLETFQNDVRDSDNSDCDEPAY